MMANKPRVICHKERIPNKSNVQFKNSKERFISADEFLKEFSFSIDSEDSKRFTNNFVDLPKVGEFSCPSFSSTSQLNPFSASSSSLQDLTSKSESQLPVSHSEPNSLRLARGKQQSLTDITAGGSQSAKKKSQRKPVTKTRHPSDSVKRDRRPEKTPSRGKITPPSDLRPKSRNATLHNSHAPPLDTSITPFSQPHKHPHIEVTLPLAEEKRPGLPLDLQNALLLSAVHLNLSAQRAYADAEKEAILQLSKLQAYRHKLQEENYKLRREAERMEFESMVNFAVGELESVEEVLTKLNLAGARMQKLSEALVKAQSTVRLRKILMSQRDRDMCEKNLRELSAAATHSLTNMRALLGQVSAVCDKVQKTARDKEGDLETVRKANERLDEFASVMLSKVSLQSHVSLLEENLALIKDPDKYFSFDL